MLARRKIHVGDIDDEDESLNYVIPLPQALIILAVWR